MSPLEAARGRGNETGIRLACTTKPAGPPGVRFVYSDINFILLGELVHRLSGKCLSTITRGRTSSCRWE